jgi:hypothetical protein
MTDTDVFATLWLVIMACLLGCIYIVLNMEVCMR